MDLRITGQREARSGPATTRGNLSVTPLGGRWGRIRRGALGCAICDPVIALWCLRGGPSLIEFARNTAGQNSPHRHRRSPDAGSSGPEGQAAPTRVTMTG
ncbi:DUF6010 family protein [Streptomyces violaceus]|uniref:DUF6010 family protein n=1 Tax=Streptomyces violaceus TaxID=1936 RepID=A0ABZ1P099_STRVL